MQSRLLPFVEGQSTYSAIDFSVSYSKQTTAIGMAVKTTRFGLFICPDEVNDRPKLDSTGAISNYPSTYAVNVGTWLAWNPATGAGGDGAFHCNSRYRNKHFTDGLSHTVCLAEVKAFQPGIRNAGLTNPAMPATAADICALGGTFSDASLHNEWTDGKMPQTTFTATFTPNTKGFCDSGGSRYDVDWVNQSEGSSTTAPTAGAVTSRSFHSGLVNTVYMDASVHMIQSEIDSVVWRALATRAGNEVVPAY
jgi:hypothetical protein